MSMREKMDSGGMIVSVETLHELAADQKIEHISLCRTVRGSEIGSGERNREFDGWYLRFEDGREMLVYV